MPTPRAQRTTTSPGIDRAAPTVASLRQRVSELERDLLAAQQTTALGELVSTTTHEFNNVLTTILNYAKMGIRHTDEPTRTKALEKILAAGQRAERITNAVLGLARNRATEKSPTDLAALCDESLVLLERELQKYRVAIETRYETRRPALVVGNQVQQVLLNLLTNARQAMPQGGQVLVRVAEDPAAGTIDLTVRDTGSGIPASELPKIFDRYYTTKSGPDSTGKGGTGLGLSACKEIVEHHGGRVRVESTVGKGTAFTLKFPVAPAEAPVVGQPV
ncbi:MAG: sensor histidine kinase, partial [Lacipirellulaceae bacterium]